MLSFISKSEVRLRNGSIFPSVLLDQFRHPFDCEFQYAYFTLCSNCIARGPSIKTASPVKNEF